MELLGVKTSGRLIWHDLSIYQSKPYRVSHPVVGPFHHKLVYALADYLNGADVLKQARVEKRPIPLRLFVQRDRFKVWITDSAIIEGLLNKVSPTNVVIRLQGVDLIIEDVVPLAIADLLAVRPKGVVKLLFKTPVLLPNSYKNMDFLSYIGQNILRRLNYIWEAEILSALELPTILNFYSSKISYIKMLVKLFRPLGTKSFRGIVGRLDLDGVSEDVYRLLKLTEYTGVGVKTSYGFGTVFVRG